VKKKMKELEFAVVRSKTRRHSEKTTTQKTFNCTRIYNRFCFYGFDDLLTGKRALRSPFAHSERTDAARRLFKGLLGQGNQAGRLHHHGRCLPINVCHDGQGVILFDAPPSFAQHIKQAVAEVTKEPIQKLIYSHAHVDFRAGGLDQSIRIEVGGDLHEFGKLGKLVSTTEAEALV
jgi:hypothetical protein